jgi:hypothetical protein
VKLVWGKAAIGDLDEIAIHISEDSLQVAELVEKRIHREAQLLVRYPRSSRDRRACCWQDSLYPGLPHRFGHRQGSACLSRGAEMADSNLNRLLPFAVDFWKAWFQSFTASSWR